MPTFMALGCVMSPHTGPSDVLSPTFDRLNPNGTNGRYCTLGAMDIVTGWSGPDDAQVASDLGRAPRPGPPGLYLPANGT
jgi:hypothetical protein